MDHLYKIEHNRKIIVVRFLEEVKSDYLTKLGVEIRTIASGLKYKVIFDFTKAKLKISFGEAYFMYAIRFNRAKLEFWDVPVAHVINSEDADFFSFVDLVCCNNNIKTKSFNTRVDARKWLKTLDLIPAN